MDLKFYIPLKEKTISPYNRARAELSIPAKLLENIMTNRQKKINNKSFDKARKNININSNCILSESTSNLKSHMLLSKLHYSNKKNIISKKELITKEYLLEENKKLKKENEELKKTIILLQKRDKNTIQKEQLTNLILSLSYEKQNDDLNASYKYPCQDNNNINLIDDNDTEKTNSQIEIEKVIKRTKTILNKYAKALKQCISRSKHGKK